MTVSTKLSNLRSGVVAQFLRDECGGVPDYALVMALFALLMLLAMRGLAHEAGGNLSNTSNHLTNMAAHS
jgi:Flp pilus assembly pilin Flp